MTKHEAAETAIQECFWGDYKLSTHEILARLDSDDPALTTFLFGKIADNARYPSCLIRALFTPTQIERVLEQTSSQPRWSDLRHRLIRANLTGNRDLVPERSWRR